MASVQKRVTKNGKATYRVQIRRKGQPPLTATFDRKTDAVKWAEDKETEVRQNRHFRYAEAKKHSVADTIDRYIETVLPRKPKSSYNQKPQLLWWKNKIGTVSLAELSPQIISSCRDLLEKDIVRGGRTRSPSSVNRYLAAFSHVITIAMKEWGWIDRHPVIAVRKLPEPKGRIRFLSDDERAHLLKTCGESQNPYLFVVVVLAISTGMRKSEILSLKWEDIDLERGVAYLFETKNSEPRSVALASFALELLKNLRSQRSNSSNYVFPSPRGDRPNDIRNAWEAARKRAGLEGFRFHDLRHTTGSYLAMNGATLTEIAEVLVVPI